MTQGSEVRHRALLTAKLLMGGLASIQTLCLLPALGFGTYRRCAIRRGLQKAQARKCKACHAIMFRNLNVMPQDECAFFAWDVNP